MSSNFRRSVQSETGKKKGTKGWKGNWREKWRLPLEVPTAFIIQSHEFVDNNPAPELVELDPTTGQPLPVKNPFFKYMKHTRQIPSPGKKPFYRDSPCSAGHNPHNPQPCVGCMAMDRQDKSFTRKEAYNLGIIHLGVYHKVPAIDPEKGPLMRKDGTGPVLNEVECLGMDCNYCRVLGGHAPVLKDKEYFPQIPPQSIQTVFGGRRYLDIGSGHLGDLGGWMKQVEMKCGGTRQAKDPVGNVYMTRCNSLLTIDGYTCSSCGSLVIDKNSVPTSPEEREAVLGTKVPCYKCQRPTFLKAHYACTACGNPVVNNLFHGVVVGMRQGEGTNSHMTLVDFNTLEDFENNLHPQLKALLGGKSLKERIAELDIPYDFEGVNKPRTLEEQATIFQVNLQQLTGGAAPTPYGQFQPGPMISTQHQQTPPAFQPYGASGTGSATPQYQPMSSPTSPGPTPFTPPTKPNFGN